MNNQPVYKDTLEEKAHEIWALAQTTPQGSITDSVDCIKAYFTNNDLLIVSKKKLEAVSRWLAHNNEVPPHWNEENFNIAECWMEYFSGEEE